MSRQAFTGLLLWLLLLAPGPRKPVSNLWPFSTSSSEIPILNAAQFDEYAAYRFSLASLCVVNIGVRRIEQTRRRVIQAGTLNVVGCILEAWLTSKGFSVGPSSNVPWETTEQHARELAAIEKKEVVVLTKALQHTHRLNKVPPNGPLELTPDQITR